MPFIDGFCVFFRGNMVQKWPIWGHHTQLHRFYGIKRWNTIRKKKKSATHLYHCDHDDRLILAIYVSCRLNQYIFFTKYPLFGSKSGSCCDPNKSLPNERRLKKESWSEAVTYLYTGRWSCNAEVSQRKVHSNIYIYN